MHDAGRCMHANQQRAARIWTAAALDSKRRPPIKRGRPACDGSRRPARARLRVDGRLGCVSGPLAGRSCGGRRIQWRRETCSKKFSPSSKSRWKLLAWKRGLCEELGAAHLETARASRTAVGRQDQRAARRANGKGVAGGRLKANGWQKGGKLEKERVKAASAALPVAQAQVGATAAFLPDA